MRVKCVKSKTDPSSGVFGIGAHSGEKIEGLTLHKDYSAQVVNELSHGGNLSVGNDIRFLVFNDDGEWSLYSTDLFVPAEYNI